MTTPTERTRALLWGGAFLIEVARDKKLPLAVRRQAVVIARHFPTVEDVASLALPPHLNIFGPSLVPPKAILAETEMGTMRPLRWSTRLAWPEE